MLAQLPSGSGRIWFVTLDHHAEAKLGRILNVRTRGQTNWIVAPDGKTISVSGVAPVVPLHCIRTVQRLLRLPGHEVLLEAARTEIQCLTRLVHDLAADLGQPVDSVKSNSWFTRKVEDRLIVDCRKFFHLAPSYEEKP
jgi:hypothetical protein